MNRLPLEKRAQILQLLCEGNSLRSSSRIADVCVNTVMKLMVDTGKACLKFHSKTVKKIPAKRIQCDEIWAFVYCKEKNVKVEKYGIGSVWTWIGMDADTRLIMSWFVGERTEEAAHFFMNDLWRRTKGRPQLTTDGLRTYQEAVADSFAGKIDFAQLVKQYNEREHYIGAEKRIINGSPDKKHISTSYIERQNLTIRMSNRRFTRKTNAFSKKIDNHCYSTAIQFVHYNFVRIHKTLRVTPAMEAKIADKPMSYKDLARLTDDFSK